MADRHSIIQTQVITDWSVQKRGRLYKMMQGTFRAMHSDAIIRVSPYPKKQDGFPDLFGFEYNTRYIKPIPVYCLIEVKTLAYSKLSEDQINHLNYCVQIGGKSYVAMEDNSDKGYMLKEWIIS